MKGIKGRSIGVIALILAMSGLFFLPTQVLSKDLKVKPQFRPVIYFHGAGGSAAQFETQAMRFASNGYPQNSLAVFEYSTAEPVPDKEAMNQRLDDFIDAILEETGAEQVDVMGKTWPGAYPDGIPGVTMEYMSSSPERAAKIAHAYYTDSALDGYQAIVPTLAAWADMTDPNREMIGAKNVVLPLHTHVQTCTSAESFALAYQFFNGRDPVTTDILPEPHGHVALAGRAILYQENTGLQDATLEIWEVDGATGARIRKNPQATYTISGDGSWGPFKAKGGQHYEFALLRVGETHHFYYEPFIRNDYFIRLITSPVGGGIGAYMDVSEGQSNVNVIRYKEFWGDQGINNDILAINGVNVATSLLCPVSRRPISVYAFDVGKDGASSLARPPFPFDRLSFMTAADLFIPAADPPNGTIPIMLMPRGGGGGMQLLNVPNWPSTTDRITAQFHDYLQDTNSWTELRHSR